VNKLALAGDKIMELRHNKPAFFDEPLELGKLRVSVVTYGV
jgi:hypothetical protein